MSNVLKYTVVAVVAAASSLASACAVTALAPHAPALRAAKAEVQIATAPPSAQPPVGFAIAKSPDGHFWADGVVNGAAVHFLVDTGATAVALTPADARRLGLTPADLHYTARVVTAGGAIRAASVKLSSMTVAGAKLDDVDALVIEEGLDTSLLGMTYLGRLSRFEATRQSLTFTP